VRFTAVQTLTDPDTLAWVALNDKSEGIRFEAVKKITDQVVLGEVAKHDKFRYFARFGSKTTIRPGRFGRCCLTAEQSGVRRDSVQKVEDQDVLARDCII